MMKKIIFMLAIVLFCSLVFQTGEVTGACRIEKRNNIWVVKLKGSPYDIGYYQGKVLKRGIAANLQEDGISKLFEGSNKGKVRNYLRNVEQIIPSEYITEMKGMAEAFGIDYDSILAFNVNIEIYFGALKVACTNAGATNEATIGRKTIHMRTLDAMFSDYAMVVAFYEREDGTSFCSVVPAGYVGLFSGMNNHGVAVGDNLNPSVKKYDSKGMPLPIFRRMILEKTRSIDEVDKMMKEFNLAIPNKIMVSDGTKNEIRVYDVIPGKFKVSYPKKDIIYSVDDESRERGEFVAKYLKKRRGNLDVEDFVKLAREEAICKYQAANRLIKSLSTVIFVPNDSNFWVALRPRGDQTPSSYNEFIGFNLLEETGLGSPSVKPGNIPAK
jgi:predicted choloylglycine hydrolase